MDIALIAQSAVTLLTPYLAKAGEVVVNRVGEAIYQVITRRFGEKRDDYAQKTLERLEEKPTDEGRQEAMATVITQSAQADPSFAEELAKLVKNASQDTTVAKFLTQVSGQATVDKIINIDRAGEVKID
jgi:hypothetical protein